MNSAQSVSADFDLNQYTLTVTRTGTGSGTVSGTNISCGTDCSATVDYGTVLTLTASEDAGSTFTGWTGCDTPSGNSCQVTVDQTEEVFATFTLNANPANPATVLFYLPAILSAHPAVPAAQRP